MVIEMYQFLNYLATSLLNKGDVDIPTTEVTPTKVQDILALVFALIGGIALIMIILGGIKFIASQGDPQGINKAKNTIIYAAIGLAISLAAFSIITFVTGKISL